MGNQLAVSGAAATVNMTDISPSGSVVLITPLGGRKKGRLFTSMHCKESGRNLVVKVFVCNIEDQEQSKLIKLFHERLAGLEQKLRAYYLSDPSCPVPCNTLFYTNYTRTERYCMLQRPYLHYSLPERLEMRPTLTPDQRLFLAYQLLNGLEQLHHAFGITHGDLKSENILITTCGWLYVTDLAPFKPSRLDPSNPADFEYYFDNAECRYCYIAPERFAEVDGEKGLSLTALAASTKRFEAKVTPSMDAFSAGCIIFQLVTDEVLFKLSDILEWRHKSVEERKQSLRASLDNSAKGSLGKIVEPLLFDLLASDPEARPPIKDLLETYTPTIFPDFFHLLYTNVMPSVLGLPSDLQIQSLWTRYDDILEASQRYRVDWKSGEGILTPLVVAENVDDGDSNLRTAKEAAAAERRAACLDVVLPVVCVALKHAKLLDSKAKALMMIAKAAASTGDALKRDLLLPHVLNELQRENSPCIVRVSAIKALRALCEALPDFPMSECLLYEDLVLPALLEVFKDGRPLMLCELAMAVPKILRCALNYVEKRQYLENCLEWPTSFDFQRRSVVDRCWDQLKPLFSHPNSSVVCAVLSSVPDLSPSLGREKVQSDLLPLMMTLLGSPVVEIRRSMITQVVHIALYLRNPTCETVHVCLEEGLREMDPECVRLALDGCRQLCLHPGCLPKDDLLRIVQSSVVLLGYPDQWVADSAAKLLEACSQTFDSVDLLLSIEGAVQPLLRRAVALSTLSKNEDFVKSIAKLSTGNVRQAAPLFSDYLRQFEGTSYSIPKEAVVKSAADIPCDVVHIDVGERLKLPRQLLTIQRNENMTARVLKQMIEELVRDTSSGGGGLRLSRAEDPTSTSDSRSLQLTLAEKEKAWRMSEFQPTPRQLKRLLWRLWRLRPAAAEEVTQAQLGIAARRGTVVVRGPFPVTGQSTAYLRPVARAPTSPAESEADRPQPVRPIATQLAFSTEHDGPIYAMANQGKWVVTGGQKGMIRLWDLEETIFPSSAGASILTPATVRTLPQAESSQALETVLAAEFQSPQVAVFGTSSGSLDFYDFEGDDVTTHTALDGGLSCIVPHSHHIVMVGTHRGGLLAYDTRENGPVWSAQLPRQQGPISAMVLLDAFGLICGTLRGSLAIFDLRFRRQVNDLQWGCCAPSGKGRGNTSSSAAGGPLKVIHSMKPCYGAGPYPSIAVATDSADVLRFNLENLQETLSLRPSVPRSIRVLAPVPRSNLMVSGGTDSIIRVWDFEKPENSFTLTCPPAKSPKYNYSASLKSVIEQEDATQSHLSLSNSHAHHKVHHQDCITALSCAVVRGQQYLVSGARDGVLKVWHNKAAAPTS